LVEIIFSVDLAHLGTLRLEVDVGSSHGAGVRDDDLVEPAGLDRSHVRSQLGQTDVAAAVDHIHAAIIVEK